jgi:hypothetical protein
MHYGMVKPLPIMLVTKFGYELTMKSKYLINLLYIYGYILTSKYSNLAKKNPALLEIQTFEKQFKIFFFWFLSLFWVNFHQ